MKKLLLLFGIVSCWLSTTGQSCPPASALPTPYYENFDTIAGGQTGTYSNCWKATTTSDPNWETESSGTGNSSSTGPLNDYSGSGIYVYMEVSSGSLGDTAGLISPTISLSNLSTPELSFYYHMYGATMGTLAVEIWNGSSWTQEWSLSGEQQTSDTDPWRYATVDLSSYSGNIKVKFLGTKGSSFTGDMSIDEVSVAEAPPCSFPFPGNLTVNSVSSSGASLSWDTSSAASNGYEVLYGVSGFNPASGGSSVTTTTESVSLSGLNANTDYDFYVIADCGATNGISDTAGPASFTTLCAPFTAPYSNGFENEALDLPPSCWNEYHTYINAWVEVEDFTGTAAPYAGTQALYLYNSNSASSDTLLAVSPKFSDMTAGDKQVRFYANSDGASELYVGTTADSTGTGTVNYLDTITFALPDTYEEVVVALTAANGYNGTDSYVVLAHSNAATYQYLRIDNFNYEVIPPCSKPTGLSVTGVTTNSFTIDFNGSASAYNVEWGPSGFVQGTGCVDTIVSTTATLDNNSAPGCMVNLAPNTLYDVYVRSDCSAGGNGTSIWEGPITFRTACGAYTAPYSMDFENEAQDAPPLCWKSYETNTFSWVEVEDFTGTSAPYAGTQALYLYASSASAASDSLYAITPRLSDLSAGDKRVNLFANSDGANSQLIIGTADTNAGTINFNPIDTITFAAPDTYEQIVVNITAANGYNGTDDYIVLAHSLGQTYQYVRIDNFKYEEIPACAPPLVSSLGVYGIGSSDAYTYWGSGSQGVKTYVEVGPAGFTPGTQTYVRRDSVAGANDTLQVTGLSGNTDYEFYIQDSCQPGGLSSWVGPIAFKTNCSLSPATLPFMEGFETYTGPVNTDGPFHCGTSFGWSVSRPGGTGEVLFSYSPISGPSAPLAGSQSAGLTSLSSTNPIYLTLTIDLSNYTTSPGIGMTFAYADHADEPNDDDRVWARGSVTDPWIEIFDWSTVNSTSWDTVSLDLKLTLQAAGQNVSSSTQVRWGQEDNAGMTGGDGFSLDELKLEVVNCPDPAVLQAVGLIDTAVTLDWTGSSAASSYEVWFGPQSFYQGTQTTTGARSFVTSDSLLVDTLSDNTCYEFLVRTVCGPGDTSAWIGPVSFCTPCSPTPAPYTEDFFNSSLPTCWDAYESTGDGWRFTGTPGYAAASAGDHTGNGGNFAWVDFSGTDAGVILESPLIDVSSLNTAALFFSHFSMNTNDFTSYNDLFVEAYNGNSWVQVDSLRGDLGGWVDFYYDISSHVFSGNLAKVRFRAEQGSGTYFYNDLLIDDVKIDEMLTCFQATNLAATAVTTTTIDLSWTTGGASNWQIEYGPAGFTPGSGTMVAVGSNPYTLSGLNPATVYDIYIRDSCGVADVGWWSTPITVQTNCVTMLNGTYTVGGPAGPNNFASLDSAVTTLNLCGVTGPVVLNLSGGTHNAVMLEDIPGVSSTNTVTFNGSLQGDSIVSVSSTAALDLNATSYVNFNRLYIENVNGNFAVRLHDQAHHITIDSCYMMVDTTTTSSSRAVIAGTDSETSPSSSGDNVDNVTISNSVIRGGYYGLNIYGFSSTAHNSGVTISDNVFMDQYYYGLRTYYMDSVVISGNLIDNFRNTTSGYGLQVYYGDFVTVSENVIPDVGTYALYLYYINRDVTSAALTSNIVNNIAHGGSGGIYSYGNAYMNFYHNTAQGGSYGMYLSGSTFYTYSNFDIRNNIIINDGTGRAMYIGTTPGSLTLDYNLYYAPTGDVAYQGGTYTTLASWVTGVSGQNANSVEGDPIFVGPTDFHVIGNLADDAGDTTVGVTVDVDGDVRPASGSTAVDIGADEFTAVSGDLALVGGDFIKGLCLTNTDSIVLYVQNIIGTTVDFSNDPLTAHWTVSGPMNSSGSVTLNSGTAAVNDSALLYGQNVDLSVPGTYTLTAYLDTNAVNTLAINDTLLAVDFEVRPSFVANPDTVILSTPGDSSKICIESSFFGGGEFFISEICHFAGASTGAPVGGKPSWLAADDYIEITGVPGSDLGGYTLEQWGTGSMTNSYTFPAGTVLGPNGTAVIAVGSASGSPSPANYFYFGDVSSGHSSGSTQGRILKDPSGAIIDAVGYGPSSYTFPTAAAVGSEWTGGQPSSTSTWGIRLTGPDMNSGTNWVSSATSPQDPNTVNSGVSVPAGTAPPGFTWSLNGSIVDTVPCTYVGPLSTPGTFNYIATFSNSCGSYSDTVVVIVPSCFAPANFGGVTLSDSSVAITWDSTGTGATSFEVQYGPAGFSPGSGTSVMVNGDSAAVSGLVNNLCQDFYIRSNCGASSGSGWIGPVNICPEASPCDDMEPYNPGGILGQSALFVGWYGTTTGNASIDTTRASGGSQSLYIPADNGTTDIVAWFDTIDAGAWNFKFDIFVPSGTNAYYNFQRNYSHGLGGINSWAFDVNYLANGTASVDGGSYGGNGIATFNYNPGQWNTIEHIIDFDNDTVFIMVNGNMTNAGWTYSFGNLTVPIQANGINFYSTTTLSNADYYIDEFCVSPYLAAGCPDPTNLALDTAACDSAVVSWSSAAGAASLVEYGPAGFVPGTGTMVGMVNSPYSITGLVPGTNYEFYVADTCAGGDTSAFVGPVSFTTLSGPTAAISHTLGMPTDSNLVVSFDASGSTNATSYSWDFGDGSTGSGVNPSHPYDSNGTYVVVLTVSGVCGTDTISDTVIVEGVSLEGSMIERSLSLYPNPAADQVQLSFYSETATDVQISLWSVNGEKLRDVNQVNHSGHRVEARIDLSDFAGGVYLIRLESGDGIVVRRLIVE